MKKWHVLAGAPVIAAGIAGAFVLFASAVTDEASQAGRLRPQDAALVARGEALYAEHCASCHGERLEGQADWQTRRADGRLPAPPHDESGHTWHHDDELLIELTQRGTAAVVGGGYESDMPGFEGILREEEIVAVLSFIKSRWPAEIRAWQDRLNQGPRP